MKDMSETLFTKIIKGEIPSYKIYEDELTYAFLDIHPVTPGHTLVIPKKPVEFVWDLEPADYQAVMATAKHLASHLRATLEPSYVGVQVVGVDVPHAHVHLIPFNTAAEFHAPSDMQAEPDHEQLQLMQQRLKL